MGNTNENFRYDDGEDFLMQDAILNQGVHHNRSDNISPTIPRSDFVPINRSLSPPANRRGYWARNGSVSPTLASRSAYGGGSDSLTNKKGFWANDGWQESNDTIFARNGGEANASGFSVNNGGQGGSYSTSAMSSSGAGGRGINLTTGGSSNVMTGSNGVSINGGGLSTGNGGISHNVGNSSTMTTSKSFGSTSVGGANVNGGSRGISLGGVDANKSNGMSMKSESYQVNSGGIHNRGGDFSLFGGDETMRSEANNNRRVTFAANANNANQHNFIQHDGGHPGDSQVIEETITTHGSEGGTGRSEIPFGIERMFTEQDSYVENVTTNRSREGTGVSLGQKIKTRAVVHTDDSPSDINEVNRMLVAGHTPKTGGSYTVTETSVHTDHNKHDGVIQTQKPWQQKVGEWKTTSVTPRIEKPGMSLDLWETGMSPQPEFHATQRSEIITNDKPIINNSYTLHNSIIDAPRTVKTVTTTRQKSETDLVLPLDDFDSYETTTEETRHMVVEKPKPVQVVKEFIQPPETRTIVKQTVVRETPRIEPRFVEYIPPAPLPPIKQFITKQPPKVETHYIEYETTPPPIQRVIVKKPPRVETRYVEYEEPAKQIVVRTPRPPPPPPKREINYVEYNKAPRTSEVSYEYHTLKPRYNTTTTHTYSPSPRVITKEHVHEYIKTEPEIQTSYNVVSDYLAPTKASTLKSLHISNGGRTSKRSSTTVDRTVQGRGSSYDVVKPRKTNSLDEGRYGGQRDRNESVTVDRSYGLTGNRDHHGITTTTTNHSGSKYAFRSNSRSEMGDGGAQIRFTKPVTVVQDVPESNITNLYTQYRQANSKLVH